MARRRPERDGSPRGFMSLFAALGIAFAGLSFAVYGPALDGPFVSDDLHYVATNPYVHQLDLENVLAILSPTSAATVQVVNYAPVHILLHAVEWQLFGDRTTGFHVVNVLLHALGSVLLVAVFLRAGLPFAPAALGGLLFLLHPANVEAVAWISQLKTTASFPLALAALLLHPRRPALGTLCFALALLAKPTAAFALPVAAALDWTREGRVRWDWLAGWALALGAYAAAEFWSHQRSGAAEPIAADPWVRLRTSVGLGARYLWMSATSLGVSAFHEPEPARSWLDPWWCAGALALLGIGVRAAVALRRRSPEVAFWIWAGASFFPVSQIFPFLYPMADRYLYFILPGLLGGGLFAAMEAGDRMAARWPALGTRLARAALAAGLCLAAVFGAHAHARAELWTSPALLLLDSASHYPEGRTAHLVRARRAARSGDADAAIAELREAWELGFNRFEQLQTDPALAGLQGDPRFRALIREIAGSWVEMLGTKPNLTQLELRQIAVAHLARGEYELALQRLEQALARGGPLDAQLPGEIAQVRSRIR
jgi:protein O-mannosyl-transferase